MFDPVSWFVHRQCERSTEPGLNQTNRASGVKALSQNATRLPERNTYLSVNRQKCKIKNISDKRCHICVSSSSGNQSRNVPTYVPFPLFLLFFHFLSAGTSWGEWCHSYWMFWWLIQATKCSFCSRTFHTLTVGFHVRSAYIKNMKVSAAICFLNCRLKSHRFCVCVCVCVCVCEGCDLGL